MDNLLGDKTYVSVSSTIFVRNMFQSNKGTTFVIGVQKHVIYLYLYHVLINIGMRVHI
jgi:hypothetical protein